MSDTAALRCPLAPRDGCRLRMPCPPPTPGLGKKDGAVVPASVPDLVDFLKVLVLKRVGEDKLERAKKGSGDSSSKPSDAPVPAPAAAVEGSFGEQEEEDDEDEAGDEMEGACDEIGGLDGAGGGDCCCDAAGEKRRIVVGRRVVNRGMRHFVLSALFYSWAQGTVVIPSRLVMAGSTG